MARYTVRFSYVDVIGTIWQPFGSLCAMRYTLSAYDIENMRDTDGKVTRSSVDHWVMLNSGDFQAITDFRASIEDGDQTIDLDWQLEDSELTYADCMFGSED